MPDITYYPARRYVEKNLAPETEMKAYDFAALAQAQRRAIQTGVLTEEQARWMIPMAIVEGRSSNYGILHSLGIYASPKNIERFQKMGLKVYDTTVERPATKRAAEKEEQNLRLMVKGVFNKLFVPVLDWIEQDARRLRPKDMPLTPSQVAWDEAVALHNSGAPTAKVEAAFEKFVQFRDGGTRWDPRVISGRGFQSEVRAVDNELEELVPVDLVIYKDKKGDKFLEFADTAKLEPHRYAKAMAAILAVKSDLPDVKTPEDAMERYNGKGRALEDLGYGDFQQADSKHYRAKVKEAREMLAHPANLPLKAYLDEVGALQ